MRPISLQKRYFPGKVLPSSENPQHALKNNFRRKTRLSRLQAPGTTYFYPYKININLVSIRISLMRRLQSLAIFFITVFLSVFTLQAQKPITLEDIWQRGTFTTKGVPGFNFQKDGVHYTGLEGTAIVQYDLRTGEKSGVIFDAATVVSAAKGWNSAFDGYSFNSDESKMLLTTGTVPLFRRSTEADYFVFDQKDFW